MRRRFIDDEGRTFSKLVHASAPLTPSPERVAAFLQIGYVPGNGTLFEGIDCLPGGCRIAVDDAGDWSIAGRFRYRDILQRGAWWDTPFDLLVREAGARFAAAVARRHDPDKDIVVPLSGGIDSRAVLSALLELRPAHRIHTYTFGTPGTNDFEIGNAVAHAAGTRHTAYDLTKLTFSTERLVRAAQLSDGNTDLFQPIVWTWIAEDFGADVEIWTGYSGDGLGGSHFVPWRSASRQRITDEFVAGASREHRWFGSDEPGPPSAGTGETGETSVARTSEWARLLDDGAMYVDAISDGEALWWANHLERYTSHHLFMNEFDYQNPFMDDELVSLFFSVDPRFRRDKSLFDAAMITRFPALFDLPTTSGLHRGSLQKKACFRAEKLARKIGWRLTPRAVPHPDTSYVDYVHGIRRRDDLRRTVRDNIEDLKTRDLLDPAQIDRVWREHDAGANRAYTLTLLASMEASFKAVDS